MAERYLATLVDRQLVAVDVVDQDHVAEAIERHRTLKSDLAKLQGRGRAAAAGWTLVLVVRGDLSDSDKEAIRTAKEDMSNRIYLMDHKLHSPEHGGFVEAANVWPAMIPGLLIRLRYGSPPNAGVWAWRTVSLEPSVPVVPVLAEFQRWVNDRAVGSRESGHGAEGESDGFELSPFQLSRPSFSLGDGKDDITICFLTCNFAGEVDAALHAPDREEIRAKAANQLRDEAVSGAAKADGKVREREKRSWGCAAKSPTSNVSMGKKVLAELGKVRAELAASPNSWDELLGRLQDAERRRRAAVEVAEVLADARSRFISWPLRLGVAFAAILLVFYLVFITLYPLFGGVLAGWTFWGACIAGIGGVVAALSLGWCLELVRGQKGCVVLKEKLRSAKSLSAAKCYLVFMGDVSETNQNMAYAQQLRNTGDLADRLKRLTSSVTR
ncbi:MAG: hypothetical protein QGF59_13880, partial [Pirellulaceae bacterium]|nr:hypothetical protein [Pirellulaceae bacterium]